MLVVEDSGPGFEETPRATDGGGIGLANTRARLDHLYPGDYALDFARSGAGGAAVILSLPFASS